MAGRIVVDDARMDAAAAKISSVQAGLQGLQGRLNSSLSAGAPPAIKGQVDAAVAQARATVGGVAGRCSARSTELRRRAIFARIASGDIRDVDLRQLIAWNAKAPSVRKGGGFPLASANLFGLSLRAFQDKVDDAASGALDWTGDHAAALGHGLLDGIGLLPVIGEPADGINGLIYAAEGDEVNAGLSFAGMIPILGWAATGTKGVGKIAHAADAGAGAGAAGGKGTGPHGNEPNPRNSAEDGVRARPKTPPRTEPKNLREQLTLDEAKAGAGTRVMKDGINDPAYPSDRWAKMQHVHRDPDGKTTTVHYWQNLKTGARHGYKFK